MFSEIISRIKAFRKPVRSLVLFSFVYSFSMSLISVFLQIALFEKFSDIALNILFAMANYTGAMLAFVVFGYLLGFFHLSARLGFYLCVTLVAISLPLIAYATTPIGAGFAITLTGIGMGLFYLTFHTYELTETKDEERDFYSSVLSSGGKIISILGPLCATSIFFFAQTVFHINGFTPLFIVAPGVILLGFFFLGGISDYHPRKIHWADITHFFTDKKNLLAQLYIGGSGAKDIIWNIIPPLVTFAILGSEIKVGSYNTALALIGFFTILFIGNKRNSNNRLFIFGISAGMIALITLYLGYTLSFHALIIFSIAAALLNPLMQVSDHVIALQTMESIGRKDQDFYATLILRDFSLWFWRMISAGILLFFVLNISSSHTQTLSLGLYMLAFLVFFSYIGARIFLNSYQKVTLKQ